MGAAAGAASVASAAFTAVGAISKGSAEQAADEARANQLDRAAQYGRAAAAETDAQDRENLNVQLDNIDVVRAAAGVDPSSPTTAALRSRTAMIGDRARGIQVGNIEAQADQNTADAQYMREAGSFAVKMGYINAAAGATGTVAKTNWSNFGAGR